MLADKTSGVLVRQPLPGAVRIGKVHPDLEALREFLMTCDLLALVMGQGFTHAGRKRARAVRETLQCSPGNSFIGRCRGNAGRFDVI